MTYTLDTCKVQPSLCVSLGQFANSILPCTGAFGRMESNTAALMKILDSLESQERMVKAMLEDRKKQLSGKSKPQSGINQIAESTAQVLSHDPPLLQLTTANTCRERCTGKCHPWSHGVGLRGNSWQHAASKLQKLVPGFTIAPITMGGLAWSSAQLLVHVHQDGHPLPSRFLSFRDNVTDIISLSSGQALL